MAEDLVQAFTTKSVVFVAEGFVQFLATRSLPIYGREIGLGLDQQVEKAMAEDLWQLMAKDFTVWLPN